MQIGHAQSLTFNNVIKGMFPILIAAFAHPLGNRKMMKITNGKLDVLQRVLGMVICSIPFWFVLCGYQILLKGDIPGQAQYLQTLIVAVFSDVVAIALFFSATDKVRNNKKQLAAVEATQSTEIIFALAGEMVLLNSSLPDAYGIIRMVLVLIGMVLHSLKS